MKTLIKGLLKLLEFLFGKKRIESAFIFGLKFLKSDLYPHALIQKGFSGWSDYENTGELNTLKQLKVHLNGNPICFDVGANDGSYSILMQEILPTATIFAFEPIKSTYDLADKLVSNHPSIKLHNKAVSKSDGLLTLYVDVTNNNDQVSSSYADGLRDFYKANELTKVEVETVSIESFCSKNEVDYIDFLKIDVEGAELAVLEGCRSLLNDNKIKFLQFEFNDFNISSRTFIKDFYKILPNYKFYRIHKNGSFPLGDYDTSLEIFKYQNILAVHQSVNFDA